MTQPTQQVLTDAELRVLVDRDDNLNAARAIQMAGRDCRSCKLYTMIIDEHGLTAECGAAETCTNASHYTPTERMTLWKEDQS